jgi:hypothetical protein
VRPAGGFIDGEPSTMTVAERNVLRPGLTGVRLSCQILCDHDMTVRAISRLEGSGRAVRAARLRQRSNRWRSIRKAEGTRQKAETKLETKAETKAETKLETELETTREKLHMARSTKLPASFSLVSPLVSPFVSAFVLAFVSAVCLLPSAFFVQVTNAQTPPRWLKGNTHTHTLNSDGDSVSGDVVAWYRSHGYQFLVITDHEF